MRKHERTGINGHCAASDREEGLYEGPSDPFYRSGGGAAPDGHICGVDLPVRSVWEQDLSNALQPPCAAHPFGTDRYGRDMLSRIIVGSRASIFSALALVAIIAVAGTVIGVICGYYGGVVDGN